MKIVARKIKHENNSACPVVDAVVVEERSSDFVERYRHLRYNIMQPILEHLRRKQHISGFLRGIALQRFLDQFINSMEIPTPSKRG